MTAAARVGLALLAWFVAGGLALAATSGASSPGTLFQWRPFLAPFHSVVLHFPIGFLTLAFVLEVYYWWRPSAEVRKVVTLVLALSVVSAGVAAGLGWLRADSGDYDAKTLETHRWSGVAVVVFAALALALQGMLYRAKVHKAMMLGYRGMLAVAVGLLILAGHQGGNLTHGSKYLVKNAPEFVRSLMEDDAEDPALATAYADEKDRFFAEKIHPIFENKCIECHSAEKQKSGYRIDVKEIALRGGKSGETAIKPGDPMHSNLVRLITLPTDNDDVMPPGGKSTLTPQEIMDIIHWISNGANFPERAPEATPETAAEAAKKTEPAAGAPQSPPEPAAAKP